MKAIFLFAILLGVTAFVRSEGEGIGPEPIINVTTTSPNSTTTAPITTTPLTTPNITTSEQPTTTTTPLPTPNTTTTTTPLPTPNTTTTTPLPSPKTTTTTPLPSPKTTTTTSSPSPNTTTTTPLPNTTTTITPPTTTPVPPGPKTGKWVVKNNNITCIVADMAIQLNITFGIDKMKPLILDVPDTANATGTCDNNTQTLVLKWEKLNVTSTVIISFEKNATTKVFSLAQVNVTLPKGVVPDFNETLDFSENQKNFSTPLSKSYKCAKVQQLNLTGSGNSTYAVLQISHVQFEAFREKNDENFGSAEDCETSNSSTDVVPIAVGCVLVGLVVIVLVAYLVGRRRSQSRGYLSM